MALGNEEIKRREINWNEFKREILIEEVVPSRVHSAAEDQLGRKVSFHLEHKSLGCRVVSSSLVEWAAVTPVR